MISLEEIYYEWQNNPNFRKEFKKNPELALKNAGYEVDAADLEIIKTTFNLSDEELDKRISK